MRVRVLLPFGGLFAVIPLLYFMFPADRDNEHLGDFSDWNPTQKEIALAVGKGGAGTFRDPRHSAFARMFQQRFRQRNIAIGLRFTGDHRLKLMCSAILPRWDMARVGVDVYHEAKSVFDRVYDVDIYETYVAMRQRKIAELRAGPATGRLAVIFRPDYRQDPISQPRRGWRSAAHRERGTGITASLLHMMADASRVMH
jgi:hypothetical protein